MGIVIKQSSYGLVNKYIGIALGYVNTVLLFPNIVTSEQFGLVQFILSTSLITSQIGQIGLTNSINKYYSSYKEKGEQKQQFLNTIKLMIVFSLIFTVGYLVVLKEQITSTIASKSPLAVENYNFLIMVSLFFVIMKLIDAFIKITQFKTVYQSFLKNVLVRILVFLNLILLYMDLINFDIFLLLYVGIYAIISALYFLKIAFSTKFSFSISNLLPTAEIKKLLKYMGYTYLSSFSNNLINQIDKFMLTALSGLTFTAIYSIASHIGTVIYAPYGSLAGIANPLVSQFYAKNQIDEIEKIYRKTSQTMIVIGSTIFLVIWFYIDLIYYFIPKEYNKGVYVVFWLGLTKIIDMTFGINGIILVNSKHYKFDLYSKLFLVAFTIFTNYMLIPPYGILGAAIATFISITVFNLLKLLIIKLKIDIQPFSAKFYLTILLLVISISCGFAADFYISQIWVKLAIKTAIILVLFLLPAYWFNVSEDINNLGNKLIKKVIG